jgi:murein DD-endopeptidase MepM/ murein hydrolase activator NlpD
MRLIVAMQAVARAETPRPGLHPDGPLEAARAGTLIAHAGPAMRAEATEVAALFAALDGAREVQRKGLSDIAAGLVSLEAARADLAARVPPLPPDPDPALVALVRASDSLAALAAGLAGPATEAAEAGEGSLAWPVTGRILRGFNEPDGAGARRPGLTLGAPALSLVAAPAEGRVRYAGPFLDFGYVVVLEVPGGALVVMAGLAELNVATGGQIGRGDLLGRLGGRNLGVEEYVMLPHADTGAGALETLYIEVRQGRGPVDPEPWFGDGNGWEGDR